MGIHPALCGLVINEFLPDPDGADSGKEFVEILNTGSEQVDLLGVGLEFANGAEGAVWVSRWQCAATVLLSPGQKFLLADRNWMGSQEADAEVWLGLQNGPDAIRLVRGGEQLDLVGYGPLTDPEMMESSPAPMVPGQAVARRPDGWDTQNNGIDFVTAIPTPGQINFFPYAVDVLRVEANPAALDRAGVPVQLTLRLSNIGTESLSTGVVFLEAFGQTYSAMLDGFVSGEERQISFLAEPPQSGLWPLTMALPVAQREDTLRLACGQYQVGPAMVVLNEVLSAPASGQGEWVELLCLDDHPLDVSEYQIRDEDGNWSALPEVILMAGDYLVLAQDASLLRGWHFSNSENGLPGDCGSTGIEDLFLELPGSWPSLNNSPPDSREFSDRLYLADGEGTVVDVVTLGQSDQWQPPTGGTWERIAAAPFVNAGENWAPSTALALGTPGCENSVSRAWTPGAEFSINPTVLHPSLGITAVHLNFIIQSPAHGWSLRLFNTWGSLVRDMGSQLNGEGPQDLIWDGVDDKGQPVEQGAYIALLEYRDQGGGCLDSEKALVLVRRGNQS